MSAYVVDREQIDLLVGAGLSGRDPLVWHDPIVPDGEHDHESGQPWGATAVETATARRRELTAITASRVGAMLWAENANSVSFRYGGEDFDTLPGPCDFSAMTLAEYRYDGVTFPSTPDPVPVLKACDSYEYQSCEHPDWEQSEACAYLDALRRSMIRALPGYDSADW